MRVQESEGRSKATPNVGPAKQGSAAREVGAGACTALGKARWAGQRQQEGSRACSPAPLPGQDALQGPDDALRRHTLSKSQLHGANRQAAHPRISGRPRQQRAARRGRRRPARQPQAAAAAAAGGCSPGTRFGTCSGRCGEAGAGKTLTAGRPHRARRGREACASSPSGHERRRGGQSTRKEESRQALTAA